jgi:hypothetical protein
LVLKIRDILHTPGVAAGEAGLDNRVRWIHVSELRSDALARGRRAAADDGLSGNGDAGARRAISDAEVGPSA